jgi:hypothetical protein
MIFVGVCLHIESVLLISLQALESKDRLLFGTLTEQHYFDLI